jgi:ferredoxin
MPATGHQLELDLLGPTASRPLTRKPWAWLLRHVLTPLRSVDLPGLRPAALDSVHSGSPRTSPRAPSAAASCAGPSPFGAIAMLDKQPLAYKCDLCGGEPACVALCPTKALEYCEVAPPVVR